MKGRIGLLFLHQDDLNFYALEINGEEKGDVRIFRLKDGEGEVLGKADGFEMNPKVWTTFRISISTENSIAVYSSPGTARKKEKILEIEDLE